MRFLYLLSCLPLICACSQGRADAARKTGERPTTAAGVAASAQQRDVVVFEGACDPSGAVPIDARSYAVADDEDNVLRVYDAHTGGLPMAATDVSPELRLEIKKKKKAKEADFEAATRIGDAALWLSSHARTKKGKEKPERFLFLKTELPRKAPVPLAGSVYTGLLADLLADARLRALGLPEAAHRAPQEQGAMNIEGMTAMPDGRVLLGFRNPLPNGRALLVPLENPLEPFAGKPARFGDPILLDLKGASVRGLSYWHGEYLIAAGHYGAGGQARVFRWAGPGHAPREVQGLLLADFNPEAFFTPEDRDEIMLLSDDGERDVDGKRCKDLEDPEAKRFRGLWVHVDGK